MIPGALGCSVARPYYNRGSTGPPPINYTPLVTGGQTAGLPINTLSLGAVTVAAGETLFAGLCVDYTIGLLVSLDVGGAGLTAAQVGTSYGSPSLRLIRFYITAAQAPYSGNLVFDFTGGVERVLRFFLVTPDMHRVHHSVIIRETNTNFGFNLPWWDRLLGTYQKEPSEGHDKMTIGLGYFRDVKRLSLWRLLIMPLTRKKIGNLINPAKVEKKL